MKRIAALVLLLALALPAIAADTKISELASGTSPQNTDQFVIARSGSNFKLTWAQMIAALDLGCDDCLQIANNLSDLASASTARTNLGLGTIATQAASSVAITGGSITGITDLAVADGGTGASNAADARTNLGLGTMAVEAAANYLTTATAATTYAPIASPTFTGTVTVPTVDINAGAIDGASIGASSASTGAFTTLSASSTVSGAGFSTYLAAPPAIGGTTPAAGVFTPLTVGAAGSQAVLQGDAANVLAQRNGTNAQTFRVYGTYTDGSNYERLGFTATSVLTEQAGTGSARDLALGTAGAAAINFRTNGVTRWFVNTAGLVAGSDNSFDFGASGANRPRSGYFGTDVSAPKIRARGGTTPTMGACGTSPSVAGNDSAMLVTVGTGGSATSCAVTFSSTWTTAPVCIAQNDTDRVAYSMVTTATTLTITATAAFTASSKFHVHCLGVG